MPSSDDELRQFVEEMASFKMAGEKRGDGNASEEDALADLSEERLFQETMTFYDMIRRARQLVADGHEIP